MVAIMAFVPSPSLIDVDSMTENGTFRRFSSTYNGPGSFVNAILVVTFMSWGNLDSPCVSIVHHLHNIRDC